jgi:DNA polymerase-1
MDDASLCLVDDHESARAFLDWCQNDAGRTCMAVDTETQGLDIHRDQVRLVQLGDSHAGWAFPMDWAGLAYHAMQVYRGPLVFHNAKFDINMLRKNYPGIDEWIWPRTHDTRIMSHLFHPDMSTALKNVCSRFLGKYASAAQHQLDLAMKEQGWDWATVPIDFPYYWGYAAIDTVLTARLFDHVSPDVYTSRYDVYQLEMGVMPILARMEWNGAAVDLDYTRRKAEELAEYMAKVELYVEHHTGLRPTQTTKLAEWFFEYGILYDDVYEERWVEAYGDMHGAAGGTSPLLVRELVKPGNTKYTPGGKLALDADVLDTISSHPIAASVKHHRDAQKIVGSYLENFMTMHRNGFVHPSINQLGARTGRMSIQNPALQTLPRGRVVRDAFISRYDHGGIVSVDSDQIEMRVLAHFSQEPSLIKAIMSGDLHTDTARRVYQDPTIDKKDARRQLAKNAGFAKIFGAGVEKFALTAGVTLDEARGFLDAYDRMFPGVREFQGKVANTARARADQDGITYVTAPSGRHHPSPVNEAYKLTNYLVQGTAADILKEQLISLDNAGFGPYMVVPVHDEVLFDFPPDMIRPETYIELERAMTIPDKYTVPITVGVDGPFERWGEKYA